MLPEQSNNLDGKTLLSLVTNGDCSGLTQEQKLMYYRARCQAAGLDERTAPLQFIKLQGKEVLYALKGATDQLAANHGIVCEILSQATEGGVRTVTVRARAKDGRQTEEIGCVNVGGLSGDNLCNAYMKTVTKAKRRATLSICGLGVLDETELETIPNVDRAPKTVIEPPKPKISVKAQATTETSPKIKPKASVVDVKAEVKPYSTEWDAQNDELADAAVAEYDSMPPTAEPMADVVSKAVEMFGGKVVTDTAVVQAVTDDYPTQACAIKFVTSKVYNGKEKFSVLALGEDGENWYQTWDSAVAGYLKAKVGNPTNRALIKFELKEWSPGKFNRNIKVVTDVK